MFSRKNKFYLRVHWLSEESFFGKFVENLLSWQMATLLQFWFCNHLIFRCCHLLTHITVGEASILLGFRGWSSTIPRSSRGEPIEVGGRCDLVFFVAGIGRLESWCGSWTKNRGEKTPPNHPFVHRVWNHYFHHPFWGTFIFGNSHVSPKCSNPSWEFVKKHLSSDQNPHRLFFFFFSGMKFRTQLYNIGIIFINH